MTKNVKITLGIVALVAAITVVFVAGNPNFGKGFLRIQGQLGSQQAVQEQLDIQPRCQYTGKVYDSRSSMPGSLNGFGSFFSAVNEGTFKKCNLKITVQKGVEGYTPKALMSLICNGSFMRAEAASASNDPDQIFCSTPMTNSVASTVNLMEDYVHGFLQDNGTRANRQMAEYSADLSDEDWYKVVVE